MTEEGNEIANEEIEKLLSLTEARDLLDIICVVNSLLQNNGNISKAAEKLDVGRRTLYDMMEKYGISLTARKLTIELTPLLSNIRLQVPNLKKYLL